MTIDEIRNDILSKITTAVAIAQEEVYTIMENVLKSFYADFTPARYERTYQLLQSCVKSFVRETPSGAETSVYFDSNMLVYTTGARPSGEQVIEAANKGKHGAEGLRMVDGDVRLFPDSEEAVARYIMPIMKEALIKAGIPVI